MKKGFTIIELIVVVAIIGILMATFLAMTGGSTESARAAKCMAHMRNLGQAVHSFSMNGDGYYPRAGSLDKWDSKGKKRKAFHYPGWISWSSRSAGGHYISPYDSDNYELRLFSLTNGTLWTSMNGNHESYVCPEHVVACRNKQVKGEPIWSYVMNAYFGWAYRSATFSHNYYGRLYRSLARPERTLMFAELPFAATKTAGGTVLQTGEINTSASTENDPVLQYQDCDGGGDECIGFNHKDNKNCVGHVCFADGHVEKLRVPRDFSSDRAKLLTKWLCYPYDDNDKEIDISFDGKEYTTTQKTGQ